MSEPTTFHESPILDSPYEAPTRHWVLDADRQAFDPSTVERAAL